MSCVLRIYGDYNVASLTDLLQLTPFRIEKRGELDRKGISFKETSCHFDVSLKGFNDLSGQMEDAIQFLESNWQNLKNLENINHIRGMSLDFGYNTRFANEKIYAQFDVLPFKLLKLAGNLSINIELSQYWASDEEE